MKSRRTSLKRARTWLGRRFRSGAESRKLIEQNAEECPITDATRIRSIAVASDETTHAYSNYDADSAMDANSLISCGSIKKLKRKLTMENGRQPPMLIMGGPIKTIVQDERWREREAERLANWAKVEIGCAPSENNTTSNIWSKVLSKTSVVSSDGNASSGPVRVNSTNSKDGKKPMVDRWSSILKQVQKNKKIAARHEAKKIDQRSRWAFPLSFLCFNVSYWAYYLYIA
uniref:Neurotransmitter-gated ion-channel transmembrane domain-containing protein n=1 Tax=Acrobeloides nanus TaxID=290746 RepID=A0A914DAG8_9BILA